MKINCKICSKEYSKLHMHLKYNHKDFNSKIYYDSFLKKEDEGICKLKDRNNYTSYTGITNGYLDYCSNSHSQLDPNTRKKIEKSKFYSYGNKNFTNREKSKKTSLKKYGNMFYNNREKCISSLINRNEKEKEKWREKVRKKWNDKSDKDKLCISEKRRKTMIENGKLRDDKEKTLFEIYRRKVNYYTYKSISKKFSKEDLSKRGRCGYKNKKQIDHMFSITRGFELNILPQIIGHEENLTLISWEENNKKHIECTLTLNDLKERIFIKEQSPIS